MNNTAEKPENLIALSPLSFLGLTDTKRSSINIKNRNLINTNEKIIANKIACAVCDFFNVSIEDVFSKSHKRELALARQVICHFLKNMTNLTDSETGSIINRDRTTCIYCVDTIKDLCHTDKFFKEKIQEVKVYIDNFLICFETRKN